MVRADPSTEQLFQAVLGAAELVGKNKTKTLYLARLITSK